MSQTNPSRQTPHRAFTLLALVLAGEAIFFLPFVIARVFRPTLLEVFEITNLELGFAFSAYGVVAMLAYFPGGPIADALAPRKLMVLALGLTSLGGLLFATIPGLQEVKWLYAYWGLTTILLFWAAMIRATRNLGGAKLAGSAFGLLDGGRGLVAAGTGSVGVLVFAAALPADVDSATFAQRTAAFQRVILVFTGITLASAALVWFAVPGHGDSIEEDESRVTGAGVIAVLKMPRVWVQAVIIICAYVAYKGLDDLSLYAKEVLLFDEVEAAYTSTVSMWVRPVAAIAAGLIADRTRVSLISSVSFAVMAVGCGAIASGIFQPGMTVAFFATMIATSAAVFAMRGLYFAIMQEGRIPFRYTGTAVGVVSAVGYTPDIFMGPLMGKLLDDSPGLPGHQHVFAVVAGFAVLGFIATIFYRVMAQKGEPTPVKRR